MVVRSLQIMGPETAVTAAMKRGLLHETTFTLSPNSWPNLVQVFHLVEKRRQRKEKEGQEEVQKRRMAEAEEVAVEEVHIHVLPGIQVYLFNEERWNWRKRRLVVHYYAENVSVATKIGHHKNFLESFRRCHKKSKFQSILFTVHYLRRVQNKEVITFPRFANNKVDGCRFERDLIDRNLYKTNLSRIDFFLGDKREKARKKPLRARALGTIVYNPMERGEAQVVHYKHELLYYLSEEPRPLTLQEWQCLGHLKRGHDSNFITFVFVRMWPLEADRDMEEGEVEDFHAVFQNTIRGREARRMAAAVGFQIREHMAFALKVDRNHFPLKGRMFKSLHDSDDIVTPPFQPNHYRGRHPDLRLEHHHVYHVYPLLSEAPGVIGPLHVLDFPETNPLFAPHLKVVLHLFYHYNKSRRNNGFGRQDTETLRQFMFDAPPVDNINRKYHRVVIHPVMYSRPIRSFLQSPGVSLVNSRAYLEDGQVAMFKTETKELVPFTLYIYPGTRVLCPFPEKPRRKSRERHLNLVYFLSNLKLEQLKKAGNPLYWPGLRHFKNNLSTNFRKMHFSKFFMSITYMCRPSPQQTLTSQLLGTFCHPFEFTGRTVGTETGMTHLSKTTFGADASRGGRHAFATGKGYTDLLEGAPYSQDCLVYLSEPPTALTYQEWEALSHLRVQFLKSHLRRERSRVTFVFKQTVHFYEMDEVLGRVMGPDAREKAAAFGFEILPHVAYPLSGVKIHVIYTTGCIFHSIQANHQYDDLPLNYTDANYYTHRHPDDRFQFHYSYHMYPGVDGEEMVPLDEALLPYRNKPVDTRCRMFLHLFFHYPPGSEGDEDFEDQTTGSLQKYRITDDNPQGRYNRLRLHPL